MTHSPDELNETSAPPKRKAGRPKGSKSRPQWMLDQLRKMPKRGRGRPKGSKNKPKTLEEFLTRALKDPEDLAVKIRPKRKPKPRPLSGGAVTYAPFVPKEVRAERARKMLAKRKRAGKPPGQKALQGETIYELAQRKQFARDIATKVYKIMETEGALPENPIAKQAMKEALILLAEENSTKDRLAIIRTLLEYNLAKPAATQNVNLKTAEDFLDELASKGD